MEEAEAGHWVGTRYEDTKHITDLETLALRILGDFAVLPSTVYEAAGTGLELQANIYGNTFMEIYLWGLNDEVVFQGRPPAKLTELGQNYLDQVAEFVQSYGWSGGGRRRFFVLLAFVGEADWRTERFYEPLVRII